MTLEQKRRHLELSRVIHARKELEFRIEEKLAEIETLKTHIEVQIKTEEKIAQELQGKQNV